MLLFTFQKGDGDQSQKRVFRMAQDDSVAFLVGPAAFIALHPVFVSKIGEAAGAAFVKINNLISRFTLITNTVNGLPGPNDGPTLRFQPMGGPVIVHTPDGGVANTLEAFYLHAGDGGMAFGQLWYCDIPIAPVPVIGGPFLLFTTGMNGCTLVVASAVPFAAAPLALGHWRVMHDHDHRSIAQWAAAGYTVHFASYADPADAGVIPIVVPMPIVTDYNPNNFPWGSPPPVVGVAGPIAMRAVTNFLYWNGMNWSYNSRHAHTYGPQDLDMDAPIAGPPLVSTLSLAL